MKTLKLLFILTLLSLQASATGFAHNMFVAHKKLQAGKVSHCVKEKKSPIRATAAKLSVKQTKLVSSNSVVAQDFGAEMNGVATLNERILKEGAAYFRNEKETEADDSLVEELVQMVKSVIYTFAGSMINRR
jgi:hypothetical protein